MNAVAQEIVAASAALPAHVDGAPLPHDPFLAMIERAARDPSVDIDKFERLMAMRERMDSQHAERAFNVAIAAAKGDIGPIVKNRTVDYTSAKGRTNYRHEDFAEIARAVGPVMKAHGLSYRFKCQQTGARLRVTCIISHVDGYSEETSLEANNDASGGKNEIQAVGSAATYLQRYTLKLAMGLAASNDDDAQSTGREQASDVEAIDSDDAAYVRQLLDETSSDEGKFLAWIKAKSVDGLTQVQFKRAIDALNKKKSEASK